MRGSPPKVQESDPVIMRVSRDFSVAVQFVLDELVPPIVRDSPWFMSWAMRLVLRDSARDFMSFKDHVFSWSRNEFGDLYVRTAAVGKLQGETDLNRACTEEILRTVAYDSVLEVGSGRGYLANLLQTTGRCVTACDIVVDHSLARRYPRVTFMQGNIEHLPVADNSFDTVVCTHTLEHVQRLGVAIRELRRVARRQLIIVVPRQRPYRYTFSLHTQFFPYTWSLQSAFGFRPGARIERLGDWFYCELDPSP